MRVFRNRLFNVCVCVFACVSACVILCLFGFEGWMWDLIILFTDICLSIYFFHITNASNVCWKKCIYNKPNVKRNIKARVA